MCDPSSNEIKKCAMTRNCATQKRDMAQFVCFKNSHLIFSTKLKIKGKRNGKEWHEIIGAL